MPKMTYSVDVRVFTDQLTSYKQAIDDDIATYSKRLRKDTLREFGVNSRLEIDSYLGVLERGGKRIRGALALAAYDMCGGEDRVVALQAARALEMLHAYILIVDDFQDRSSVRRGGPTAHKLLAQHHAAQEWAGSSEHFGASIALNAALSGGHAAQQALAGLDVPAQAKLEIINTVNHAMMVTAHGQTTDIINEVVADVSDQDIEHVLEWKTAHYTILNPIRVGMLLAGAPKNDILAVEPYAMHTGKAFQITDDILGTFGTEFDSGKSPMDDIREGKRTLLTAYALDHTTDDNKNFLVRMLGKMDITPVEFDRCKAILVESGALRHAQKAAEQHVSAAIKALDVAPAGWSSQGVAFLRGLAHYLLGRTA